MPEDNLPLIYQLNGGIAQLTLNRPDKRNALNDALVSGLRESLARANNDPAARVIVITGAGKDFCAGADLSALQKISEASVSENSADARSLMELFAMIRELKIPVVAAVRGRALAGGCGLANSCDLVLASENARFGYPEVKLGFVPAMVTAILRRNISEKSAFELLTRGEEISASEAKSLGLVNQVFAEDEFETGVESYLHSFEKISASAIALTKTLLYQMDGLSFREAIETGLDVNVIARMTEDCQAGIARFLKKS